MTEKTHIVLTNNMISSRTFDDFVEQWKGQDKRIDNLFSRVMQIEQRLDKLEQPERLQRIISLLKQEATPRTSEYINNRISNLHWYDFNELENMQEVKVTYAGHRRMYSLIVPEQSLKETTQ